MSPQLQSNTAGSEQPFDGVAANVDAIRSSMLVKLNDLLLATTHVDHLFDMFFFEGQELTSFDGIKFRKDNQDCQYNLGIEGTHSAHYRLFARQDYIGELSIYRNTPFTETDLQSLETLISVIIEPLRKTLGYLKQSEA